MADPVSSPATVAAVTVRPGDAARTGGVPQPQVAQFDSASIRALSPETRESFAAALVKGGYTEAQVRAALSGTQTSTPATPATTPAVEINDQTKGITLSAREEAAAAQFWSGVPPEQYDLRSTFVGRGMDLNTAREMDGALRSTFSSIELPAALAGGLAEQMLETGAKYQSLLSDAQRALYWQSEKLTMERVMKMPYAEVAKLAQIAASKIPPETVKALAQRNALDSAKVFVQLALQGQRLQSRKSM